MVKKKDKTSNAFDKWLGVFAILAFATILLDSIFNIAWLTSNISNILILGAGILLLVAGKFMKTFKQLFKGKVSRKMIPKLFVSLVGLVAFIVGGLSLVGLAGTFIATLKGGVSLVGIIFIALEIWVISD